MAGDEKNTNAELAALQLEETQLRLEDLRYRVQNERNRRDAILRRHKADQDSIDQTNRDIIAKQSTCKHRKGGKNLQGIVNGNSSEYSIWKHTYPWGATQVICSRCGKTWDRPPVSLRASSPKDYLKQMKEYEEAINWPTDNEPSGSVLFTFTREEPPTRSAAR